MSEVEQRREIVYATYKDAIKNGDKSVYFISGKEFFEYADKDAITCDGVHPNDFGFWCMAQVIGDKIKEIRGRD